MDDQQTAGTSGGERRSGDRRSSRGIGGRRRAPRRAEDRRRLTRDMAALVFALCGGLAVVYLFFAAMGAVNIGEALTATAIALGLGLVWMLGFGYRMRTHAFRSQRADKERRGF